MILLCDLDSWLNLATISRAVLPKLLGAVGCTVAEEAPALLGTGSPLPYLSLRSSGALAAP